MQELAAGGDLYQLLASAGGHVSETLVSMHVVKPLLQALTYLHNQVDTNLPTSFTGVALSFRIAQSWKRLPEQALMQNLGGLRMGPAGPLRTFVVRICAKHYSKQKPRISCQAVR